MEHTINHMQGKQSDDKINNHNIWGWQVMLTSHGKVCKC